MSGSAVFAGGPYYCARDSIQNALTACTVVPELLDVATLVRDTQSFASDGRIDSVDGLKNDRVFLYSGIVDTVVHQRVVKDAADFYINFSANVTTEFARISEHSQPTLDYGNSCIHLGTPFINKCDYDGAGEALKVLYGSALKPRGTPVVGNLFKVDQRKHMPGALRVVGLADFAYLYVPTSCQTGANCSFHVNFHGCQQDASKLGTIYAYNTGFVNWAESNNIIILFPQAAAADLHDNPEACFDWWGYVDHSYAFKTSQQMTTFRNMLQALATPAGLTMVK